MYRSLFKFGVFNAIQSQCFDSVSIIPSIFMSSFNMAHRLCIRRKTWYVVSKAQCQKT